MSITLEQVDCLIATAAGAKTMAKARVHADPKDWFAAQCLKDAEKSLVVLEDVLVHVRCDQRGAVA